MIISAIHTKILLPPQDDLYAFLETECPVLEELDVLVISSKLLAIHQGRCLKKTQPKDTLIAQEADYIFDQKEKLFTIKNHTFVPFAGIDESNANDHYILWPENPYDEAKNIHAYLCKKFCVQKLGIIIVDSTLLAMRKGTIGISIGHFGILPVANYRGTQDLFGRVMTLSAINIVDAIASTANLVMGEGQEQQPLALVKEVPYIEFCDTETQEDLYIDPTEDMFASILSPYIHKEP